MARTRKEKVYLATQAVIKETAWRHIAENGASALSLRAIARDMEVTAPALYRYYPDRDALVTALIVDAFASFADSLSESIAALPETEHAERLRALGLSYRDWALAYPERYQLIFGTPIAGYVAPMEITQPVAGRSLATLVGVLQSAHSAMKLRTDAAHSISSELKAMFAAWQDERGAAHEQVQFLALSIWGQVHGLVSAEIGHQFPPFITDPGEIYRHILDHLIRRHFPDFNEAESGYGV